jgi:hypothetical protein
MGFYFEELQVLLQETKGKYRVHDENQDDFLHVTLCKKVPRTGVCKMLFQIV